MSLRLGPDIGQLLHKKNIFNRYTVSTVRHTVSPGKKEGKSHEIKHEKGKKVINL